MAPLGRRLRARLGGLRVGDPLDPGTDVGPLPPTAAPPEGLVHAAREEGAEVRGHRGDVGGHRGAWGCWVGHGGSWSGTGGNGGWEGTLGGRGGHRGHWGAWEDVGMWGKLKGRHREWEGGTGGHGGTQGGPGGVRGHGGHRGTWGALRGSGLKWGHENGGDQGDIGGDTGGLWGDTGGWRRGGRGRGVSSGVPRHRGPLFPQVFQPPVTLPPGGRFYPPTLITGVAPTSRCLREPVGARGGVGGQRESSGRGCWGAADIVCVCGVPDARAGAGAAARALPGGGRHRGLGAAPRRRRRRLGPGRDPRP